MNLIFDDKSEDGTRVQVWQREFSEPRYKWKASSTAGSDYDDAEGYAINFKSAVKTSMRAIPSLANSPEKVEQWNESHG